MKNGMIISWFAAALSAIAMASAHAQSTAERVNQGIVGVIAGSVDGTSMHAASDLAWELDQGNDLRILPIQGKGSVQAITDLLYLRGIDIAIVQRDALEYSLREGIHPNIEGRIRYIARLFNEEIHVVAKRDITSIDQLQGQAVNIGTEGSGADLTSSLLFQLLGVQVNPVQLDHARALDKLLAGELAAMVYVGGQPAPLLRNLTDEDGLHLLPIDYTPELLELYLPARFDGDSYPGLIRPGGSVDTVAVEAIMAVYNWPRDHPRHAKVSRFVNAFFDRLSDLQQPPRHRKWLEVRLDAELPGWRRFGPAAERLKAEVAVGNADLERQFEDFLASRNLTSEVPDDLKRSLFAEFVRWQGGDAAESARSYTFALVPKAVNNAFFNVAHEGCIAADAELADVECLYVGPGELAEQEQAQVLQNLIDQGIDGIALSPTNSPLLAGVLRRAEEAGIPVITWDADLEAKDSDLRQAYIGSDNYQIGVRLGEMGRQLKPEGGTFCVLTVTSESTNTNLRIDGLRDTLSGQSGSARLTGRNGWSELEGCPKEHRSDVATAMEQLNDLLLNHPDLDVIFSVSATPQRSDADYREVIEPYRDRLAKGQLLMIMADTLPIQMEHLGDGLSHAQIGQRPFEMGYRAMEVLRDLSNGRPVPNGPIYTDLDICVAANIDSCIYGQTR